MTDHFQDGLNLAVSCLRRCWVLLVLYVKVLLIKLSVSAAMGLFPLSYLDPAKVVWTGCPCHHRAVPSRSEGLLAFGLEENKKTIVLIGGSQGSQRLNEIFFELMKDISPASPAGGPVPFQAIHMTGLKD